jgi:hypothetical protein
MVPTPMKCHHSSTSNYYTYYAFPLPRGSGSHSPFLMYVVPTIPYVCSLGWVQRTMSMLIHLDC